MKQRYSFLMPVLLVFALSTHAQTLTQATSVPAVGQTETRTYYGAFGNISVATTGTGVVWDLTSATPFGVSNSVTYTAPGESPYAALHPTSNLALHSTDGVNDEWRHFRVTADTAELQSSNTDVFDGARTLCVFPFSMGSSFTDTYSINGGSPNTETNEYVASGQITAPWGTIPNVVMVSVNGGLAYYFYSADNVLDAVGSYSPGFGADLWRVESSTAVATSSTPVIGVWPMPAHDQATVSLPFSGEVRMRVLDHLGREMRHLISNGPTTTLDLQGLAAGVYVVCATDLFGHIATERLVKE